VPAVTSAFFFRRRAERFAQLLDEAGGGRRHHVRSRLDAELAELVAIGHQASTLRPASGLDPDFRDGLRAMLVATAEREGIGRTARAAAEPGTFRSVVSARSSRVRTRGAVIVGVAIGAIAVSGMSAASENAVPGDALYGVKRSTERAQLALASSDVTRGQLYLDFARTRVAEAAAVVRDSAGYGAVLDDMDADSRHGVKLLTTSAVARRDPAALDAIAAFVATQRLDLAGLLDDGTPANRARTLKSLTLLDSVTKRADALRATLSCATPSSGADKLGPKPRPCNAQAPAAGGAVDAGQADQRPVTPGERDRTRTEEKAGPAANPVAPGGAPAGDGPAPATDQPATPMQAPEPTPTPAADEDDSLLGTVGRKLGGLLG
jgi:hypothetical protein